MTGKIFSKWDETHSELWSHQPIRLEHEMHKSPAFSMDELAQLIESYPREHYSLVKTGARGSSRVWREGDIGNLSGRQVIDAISRGGLWLNMRNVGSVDQPLPRSWSTRCSRRSPPRFRASRRRTHQAGILISSPDAQVYYHADLPGQGLIQIAGRKRVYVYPNTRAVHHAGAPRGHRAVRRRGRSALRALVRRACPGVRSRTRPDAELAAERAAPRRESRHRQHLDDGFLRNDDIRRAEIVNLANGLLRHRFGYTPKSRNLRGPSYFAKAVMQKLCATANGSSASATRAARSISASTPTEPGKIVDLPKAA